MILFLVKQRLRSLYFEYGHHSFTHSLTPSQYVLPPSLTHEQYVLTHSLPYSTYSLPPSLIVRTPSLPLPHSTYSLTPSPSQYVLPLSLSLTASLSIHSSTEPSTSLPLSHVEQIDRQIDRSIDILTSRSIQMHQQMDGKLQITYFGSCRRSSQICRQIDDEAVVSQCCCV